MSLAQPSLLLTRPSEASARFAAAFAARFGAGWPIVYAPLMQTRWLEPAVDLNSFGEVIFTSETAVRAFCKFAQPRGQRAWCVGERTAQVARDAGFSATAGQSGALVLAEMILRDGGGRTMLWPRGVHVAKDLAELLKTGGIDTVSAVIYQQDERPLTQDALSLLSSEQPILLPLFSPRSAKLFAAAAAAVSAPLYIACMSISVAEAAKAIPHRMCRIAAQPDSENLLDCLSLLVRDIAYG